MGLSLSSMANAAMYAPPPATAVSQDTAAKNGFYVGIGLGGLTLHDSITSTYDLVNGDASGISSNSTMDQGSNLNLNSNVLAGYAWRFSNKLFLGVEAFGTYNNASVGFDGEQDIQTAAGNNIESIYSGDYTMHYTYGVRALPGYQIKPGVVAYGIVGYSHAHGDLNYNDGSTTIDSNETTFPAITYKENYDGYQLGLGSMVNITKNVLVRADVIYTGYSSQTINAGTVNTDSDSLSTPTTFTFSTLEGDFSLIYQFD